MKLKPALQQLANIGLSSYASLLSMHPPASTTGLRVLCLAGYGEANVGTFSTPVGFMDPQDPVTRLRLPLLGLDFLRLDRESTKQLISRFTKIKASHITFDAEVFNLIYDETNGHVGAIRMLLYYLVDTDKRSKQDVLDFTRYDVPRHDLSAFRAFLSVSQTTIGRLPSEDIQLLVQFIASFKKGIRNFPVREIDVADLVKLGVVVKTSGTGSYGATTVSFPSPLHFDMTLYNILNRRMQLQQNHNGFEQLLRELVLRMSPKVLLNTTQVPLECRWQDQFSQSFPTISSSVNLKMSVGSEYGQRAFLDLYIDGFQWGWSSSEKVKVSGLRNMRGGSEDPMMGDTMEFQCNNMLFSTSPVKSQPRRFLTCTTTTFTILCTTIHTQRSLSTKRKEPLQIGISLAIRGELSTRIHFASLMSWN